MSCHVFNSQYAGSFALLKVFGSSIPPPKAGEPYGCMNVHEEKSGATWRDAGKQEKPFGSKILHAALKWDDDK